MRLWHGGSSRRRIAQQLGISRHQVEKVLAAHQRGRSEGPATDQLPRAKRRRARSLDKYEQLLEQLLKRYPDITAVRAHEELQKLGFGGSYNAVKRGLRELRPVPDLERVQRFETAPGEQAQMDYSTYTLAFTQEGPRRVHLFSYVLGYSRRQYLRFVESQDFATTVREHVRAFTHLGGVAATCLYDNMKVVVSRYDGDEPVYNTRFLAFATHYGYRPWACRPRRGQTKGKVERPFDYVEKNLLNGRTILGRPAASPPVRQRRGPEDSPPVGNVLSPGPAGGLGAGGALRRLLTLCRGADSGRHRDAQGGPGQTGRGRNPAAPLAAGRRADPAADRQRIWRPVPQLTLGDQPP